MGIEIGILARIFTSRKGASLAKWAVPVVTFFVWAAWPAIPASFKNTWTLGLIRDPEAEAAAAAAAAEAAAERA